MFNAEDSYSHDGTFRRVVDQMRALLGYYEITATELRLAAMLASSMHEAQRIRPLLIPAKTFGGTDYNHVFIDEWSTPLGNWANNYIGRMDSSKPNLSNIPQERFEKVRSDVEDRRVPDSANTRDVWERRQGDYASTNRNRTTGDRRIAKTPVPVHNHTFYFSGKSQGYNICDCGISDVYYNNSIKRYK